jgi:hypothetical protein
MTSRMNANQINNSTDARALRAHVIACGGDVAQFDRVLSAAGVKVARSVAHAANGHANYSRALVGA